MPGPLPDDWAAWRARIDLDEFEARWDRLEASGAHVHGEADLVCTYRPESVLDAGCGTGRLAIELDRRGIEVVGVDLDDDLLARARRRAPQLAWVHGDLATLDLGRTFDAVVLAGNVVPYAAPGVRGDVVARCAAHVRPAGVLIAGFSLLEGWPTVEEWEGWCGDAGLESVDRWSTWDRAPFEPGRSDYLVSVHTRP